ncbi:thioredoxin [Lutispora thermophila]|uniref:Thioredoxin n=1 Tax=Lutispora thermophila DSM 19022 TaxID=1122184 RepID=A0A1M6HNE4_9FIRM|nr:thioredoxin [Lutispora thermophila]SHJ23678.1 thioredoxin [Lutispora thermophila DSM 19022]
MNKKVNIVNESTFEQEVLNSDKPVLVDFWAAWCGPCRMVSPIIDELAEEYDGKLKVVKVNVDENPKLASEFEIMSIPSVFLFKNGKKVDGLIGVRPKQMFESMINNHI